MDYKEKYEQALKRAKKNYDVAQDLCDNSQIGLECFKNTLINIFPELKESEDERIVRCLLNYFKHVRYNGLDLKGTDVDEVIAWLEKNKKLDPDKVIAWLVANICNFEYYVKLFKKDFGLC